MVVALAAVMLMTGAALVPLPVRVTAPVAIEPAGAQRVYVTEPGTLEFAARAGTHVEAGDTLARLVNADTALEIARLTGHRDRQRLRLEHLERRRGQDRVAAGEIPAAREALADLEERLVARQAAADSLTLRAPASGTVLPPEWRSATAGRGALPGWSGSPLDEQNRGATLATGTVLCLIGDPRRVEAVALVDQADVERIAVDHRAEVLLAQGTGRTLMGTVVEIAEIDTEAAPRGLLYGGDLPVGRDRSGVPRPLSTAYQVRIRLDAADTDVTLGAPGRVRIHAAPESLVSRVVRWLRGTFHFAA